MTTLTRIISIFYLNVADLSKLRKLQRSARSLKSEKSAVVEELSSLLGKMVYKDKDLSQGGAGRGTGRCQPSYREADGGPAAEGQVCPPC